MSRHNYNGYSKPKVEETEAVVEQVVETKTNEPEVVDEPVVAPSRGTVCDCQRLNVRKGPDIHAEVICEIVSGAKVTIDNEYSIEEWYKVRTENGTEGFCMKKYVAIDA